MKPFRTFVNKLGVAPHVCLFPEDELQPSNLTIPLSLYSHLYWNLKKLTIDYRYRIEGDVIHHKHVFEKDESDLCKRIQGLHHYRLKDKELIHPTMKSSAQRTTTMLHFFLDQPYDPSLPPQQYLKSKEQISEFYENPLTLCKDSVLPPDHLIHLRLFLEETGYEKRRPTQGKYFLTTWDHSGKTYTMEPSTLSQIQGTFMEKYPLNVFIYKFEHSDPDLEGELFHFSVTAEFFTFEDKDDKKKEKNKEEASA